MKLWYDLILDIMIWAFHMPLWLWQYSGELLISMGLLLPNTSNDIMQGAMFLVIHYFLNKGMEIGWSLFETFDIKERHEFNNTPFSLFVKDELKSMLLWLVFGLPIYWLFMLIIEWGGSLFVFYLLAFCITMIILHKYVYIRIIAPCFNKFTPLCEYDNPSLSEKMRKCVTHSLHDLAKKA